MMSDYEFVKLDIDALSDEEARNIALSIFEKDREIYGKRALKSGILFAVFFLAFMVTLIGGRTVAMFVLMAIGMMIGTWAFENLWMYIRIPAICKKILQETYKLKPKEILWTVQDKIIEKMGANE